MVQATIELSGALVNLELRYAETARYFGRFLSARSGQTPPVRVRDEDWAEILRGGMPDCAHTEYSILTAAASDALTVSDRCLIHAVAIRRRDRAWLIAAPSGTGKSTQAYYLQALWPEEFSVICGDRPVLSFQDRAITVHPSPWNGKEDWHGAEAAPLAGVIYLQRGERNELAPLSKHVAGSVLYPQFIQTSWEPEIICKIAALETRLLNAVPCWKLCTNTVPDSTRLLCKTLFSEKVEA